MNLVTMIKIKHNTSSQRIKADEECIKKKIDILRKSEIYMHYLKKNTYLNKT